MKYFVRSVKYFIYFSLLCTLIVYALVLTGMASGDINEIFEGGYDAIWKIAVFFALVNRLVSYDIQDILMTTRLSKCFLQLNPSFRTG